MKRPSPSFRALPGQRLEEIFTTRSRQYPHRIAVSDGRRQYTYRQLDGSAERLASRLRAAGVGPENLVCLFMDRRAETIVAILGILKAGGAYLPIDPSHPVRRIRSLLEESAASIAVTTRGLTERLAGCPVSVLLADGDDDHRPLTPSPRGNKEKEPKDLAYVIYTSGSTGVPKGVMIEHRNVIRLFEGTDRWFRFGSDDVWALFHSVGFDFSVWEIWGALLYGGRLALVPSEAPRSPRLFQRWVREQGITVLNQTPSAFRYLLTADGELMAGETSRLRWLIFGGERLEVEILRPWIDRHRDRSPGLVNMYGITETTVHVTYRRIWRQDLETPEVSPIGIPLPDLELRLLDDSGGPVAPGETGRLFVAGAGVARGYWRRPELTAERFRVLSSASGHGRRWYDSGDRARLLLDGSLAYEGRSDDQVQVRGFRVEPREVELCLSAHEGVAAVLVAAQDYGEGDRRLAACVVADPGAASEVGPEALLAGLRERARAELPEHLRPSVYYPLAELPLNVNGKVDRLRLTFPMVRPSADPAPEEARLSRTERVVVEICQEVLQLSCVDVDEDLYDLGATSLSLSRILAITNERLGVSLTGAELGDLASVVTVAAAADLQLGGGIEASARLALPEATSLPS